MVFFYGDNAAFLRDVHEGVCVFVAVSEEARRGEGGEKRRDAPENYHCTMEEIVV